MCDLLAFFVDTGNVYSPLEFFALSKDVLEYLSVSLVIQVRSKLMSLALALPSTSSSEMNAIDVAFSLK